jgi:hypothetical protein
MTQQFNSNIGEGTWSQNIPIHMSVQHRVACVVHSIPIQMKMC